MALALALPMLGLGVLLAQPDLDVHWQHQPSHFWLVLAASAINGVLAAMTGTSAQRRHDFRVFLVSLAFLSAAGFLGLHALATPKVLLEGTNPGFTLASPIGLLLAAALAAASSIEPSPAAVGAVTGRARLLTGAVLALLAGWAAVSLLQLTPFDDPSAPARASGPLVGAAVAGIALYAMSVVRYLGIYRIRRSPMVLGMTSAFVLLAEALVAIAAARDWRASWWEWHLLMLAAFGLIAWSAQRQWHEERFSDLYVDDTTGGSRDVTVLFADLEGVHQLLGAPRPPRGLAMLNEYFRLAVRPSSSATAGGSTASSATA